MAVAQRRPAAVIPHADQGCPYPSMAFGLRGRAIGVRPPMGSVGDAYDNALCESVFATLETDRLDRPRFTTHVEARMAVFSVSEGGYTPPRRHSALAYDSPVTYERRHQAVA